MTLINSLGGTIGEAIALGQHYAAIGAHLKVVLCASACLFTLAQVPHDHICFPPDAWLGDHSRAWHGGPERTQTMVWWRGRDMIAKGWKQC